MASNLDREVLLRVKTDVQGIPQVEQLSGSLRGLEPAGKAAQSGAEQLPATLRDVENRATAANASLANTTRVVEDVNAAIDDAQNLFELLKLEYIEGNMTLEEYNAELGKLRASLNRFDGDSTKLLRTKRALSTEQTRLTNTSRQAALGFQGTSAQASSANSILFESQNLVRGLNGDFPAMAQSVVPVLRSFNQLTLQSGGMTGAFRSILGVIGGPMGLVFLIGSMLPTAIIAAQSFLAKFREESDETAESLKNTTKRVLELIQANNELAARPSAYNIDANELTISQLEKIIELREKLEKAEKEFQESKNIPGQISAEVRLALYNLAQERVTNLRNQLGRFSDSDIQGLRDQLTELRDLNKVNQSELNEDTLDSLRERLKVQLELLKGANADELAQERAKQFEIIETINLRLMEATGRDRDELKARLKMHEDYVWQLAALYTKLPKPVTPEVTPPGETPTRPELPEPGPLPAAPRVNPNDTAYDAKVERMLSAARSFQEQLNTIEIDLLRQAGQEKEALAREQEAELRRIRLEALEAGLLGTEQHLALEQQIREYYANEQKLLDADVFESKVAFATAFMDAVQGIGAIMYGDSERNAKRAFEVDKALSLASAIVYGGLAINRALATSPWEVAAVTVTTAAQIAKIAATKFRSPDTSRTSTGFTGSPAGPTFGLRPNEVQAFHARQSAQSQQPVVVNIALEGEFDPEVVHVKAKEGERAISARTITIKK